MSKTKRKLTSAFISSLSKPEKRIEYFDTLVSGLFLRLYKSGSKTYFYRYRRHGKLKQLKIGTADTISLAGARKECKIKKGEISKGADPQAERQAKRNKPKPKTFDDLARLYKDRHFQRLKPSTQKTYRNRIDVELMPVFGGMQLQYIDRNIIFELLEEIAFGKDQPTHSNRVRAVLSSMFGFGVQRGTVTYNPVKTIKPLGDESERDRVFTEDETKKLWEGFETLREPLRSALKILLLLGQRKTETCRMRWDDIQGDVWTIVKEENKAKRNHKVPLPQTALELIKGLENDSRYVFDSNRKPGQPISTVYEALQRVAGSVGVSNVWVHDLRRTAGTFMAELGTSRTVLGKVLNHKELAGDSHVTARYDRYGYLREKRNALNRWNNKLQQIITGETETKIHKIG